MLVPNHLMLSFQYQNRYGLFNDLRSPRDQSHDIWSYGSRLQMPSSNGRDRIPRYDVRSCPNYTEKECKTGWQQRSLPDFGKNVSRRLDGALVIFILFFSVVSLAGCIFQITYTNKHGAACFASQPWVVCSQDLATSLRLSTKDRSNRRRAINIQLRPYNLTKTPRQDFLIGRFLRHNFVRERFSRLSRLLGTWELKTPTPFLLKHLKKLQI